MRNELLNHQGKPFLCWEFNTENNWLYLNWQGYISKGNGLKASLQFLEILEENHYPYLLNDNREVLGPWGGGKEGNRWLQEFIFPKVVAAGLRCIAHIQAPGIASALLAQDLHQRLEGMLHMQLFGDAERAGAWLRSMQEKDKIL